MDYNRLHTASVILLVVIAAPAVTHFLIPFTGVGNSYVVLSDSMEPRLSSGDLIFTLDTPAKSIDEGDIITFRYDRGESTTTHRVIETRTVDGQRAFVTKGDANEEPDPNLVKDDMIVGRLALTIPYYGHIIAFASSRLGAIMFIVVPSVVYILLEARSLWLEATASQQLEDETHE